MAPQGRHRRLVLFALRQVEVAVLEVAYQQAAGFLAGTGCSVPEHTYYGASQ